MPQLKKLKDMDIIVLKGDIYKLSKKTPVRNMRALVNARDEFYKYMISL
jgi:predicted transcriptional regulator